MFYRHNAKEKAKADLIFELRGISFPDSEKFADIIERYVEKMVDVGTDDVYDKIKKRGEYDPYY